MTTSNVIAIDGRVASVNQRLQGSRRKPIKIFISIRAMFRALAVFFHRAELVKVKKLKSRKSCL